LKQVCYFHNPAVAGPFRDYDISTLDPTPYFLKGTSRWRRRRARARLGALLRAEGVDSLYRERDPDYMRFAGDFVDAYRNAHLLIMATYNPLHPEILRKQLPLPTKILGFIDDPYSTYVRGIPYLWAFDGAFYISPGYDERRLFADALREWGCRAAWWFPLVTQPFPHFEPTDDSFRARDIDVVYIGKAYGNKIDRLVRLKRHLGNRMRVHGRWALRGHVGWVRGVVGKPVYPYRVSPLSDAERCGLYLRAKIGIDIHLSNTPAETGNMRMYEVPAHGAMLLCDKAALNAHALIFKPDVEAIFYDNLADALAKIEYYVAHPAERIAIARAGFERVRRDYDSERVLRGLLDWASGIRRSQEGE
jgi:hypothetical protein